MLTSTGPNLLQRDGDQQAQGSADCHPTNALASHHTQLLYVMHLQFHHLEQSVFLVPKIHIHRAQDFPSPVCSLSCFQSHWSPTRLFRYYILTRDTDPSRNTGTICTNPTLKNTASEGGLRGSGSHPLESLASSSQQDNGRPQDLCRPSSGGWVTDIAGSWTLISKASRPRSYLTR